MALPRRSARTAEPRIVRDPRIVGGEPVVAGTRVPVRSIILAVQAGDPPGVIHRSFPTLPGGGLEAAVAYYADHREEVDRLIALGQPDDWS